MRVIRNFQACPEFAKNSVIAIGNFDGVHKGHQKIISAANQLAKEYNTNSAIMTFEPHPAKVFGNLTHHARLTPFAEKARILKKMGVNFIFAIRFSKKFAQTSKEIFVNKIICEEIKAKHVIVGSDFTFGKNKSGDTEFLQKAAKEKGFGLTIVDTVGDGSNKYSSRTIKTLLKEGKLDEANKQLGRPYKISGRIMNGEKLAAKLGFPTANIKLKNFAEPKYGVYAVKITVSEEVFSAVANVGIKPTFSGTKPLLEVNIFEFNKNIYGKKISVEFFHLIREEKKFNGPEELKKQISKDVEDAKNFFKRNI